jgi:hypothetical protein
MGLAIFQVFDPNLFNTGGLRDGHEKRGWKRTPA